MLHEDRLAQIARLRRTCYDIEGLVVSPTCAEVNEMARELLERRAKETEGPGIVRYCSGEIPTVGDVVLPGQAERPLTVTHVGEISYTAVEPGPEHRLLSIRNTSLVKRGHSASLTGEQIDKLILGYQGNLGLRHRSKYEAMKMALKSIGIPVAGKST